MPLINSYALWNNKGGVGKSTISFIYEICGNTFKCKGSSTALY
jgi:hypothetical protein